MRRPQGRLSAHFVYCGASPEGPLTEPTAGAQLGPREVVFMPPYLPFTGMNK